METKDYTNSEGSVVNIDYLRQLSKGNTKFVDEMIRIFLTENPEEIKILEGAIHDENYDLIKATTHKLRSTLPYIGLDKLVEEEVTEIETLAAKKTGVERIGELFSRIKDTCEKACVELQTAA
jgi:HPt (histidine-containing phosphotransfer) domain-containing protein